MAVLQNYCHNVFYIYFYFFFFTTVLFFILTVVKLNCDGSSQKPPSQCVVIFFISFLQLFENAVRIGRLHGIGRLNLFYWRFLFAWRLSSKLAKRRHFSLFFDFSHFSTIFRNLGLFFLLSPSPFIWCQNFWRMVRFCLFIFKNRSSAI